MPPLFISSTGEKMTDKMLDIQIVRALKATGPLTRKQIITRVNDNQLDVEATLDAMITIGCLRAELSTTFKGHFEYHLKTNFGESDCKRSDHRQKIAMYVAHHGSASKGVIPPVTGILFSEGLDRAIWKAANTGRWMMVREIRDILTAVGFRRDDVVARIQYHINTGRWFDRQAGSRNAQFFMLRSDVECPEIYGTKPKRGENRVCATLDDAGLFPAPAATAVITSESEPVKATMFPVDTAVDLVKDTYFPLSILGETIMDGALAHARLLVKADGTLSEAVWAILGDGEEYSSTDIVALLKQFGYTSSQISPLLSKRYAEGLLTRRLVMIDGRWVNIYKKAAELPEKYTMQKSVVSAIVEAQQPKEKELIAATHEINMMDLEEKPELFDSRLRIKGVEIDIVDFTTLYKELSDAGFVRDMHKLSSEKPGNRLLTTTHVIKGVPFERDELSLLAKAMYTLANRFKLAIVV
jgi:hypothetical protein